LSMELYSSQHKQRQCDKGRCISVSGGCQQSLRADCWTCEMRVYFNPYPANVENMMSC
jgi:hypothetical protein